MRKLATGLYCITFLVYHPQHGSRGVGSAFSRVLLCVRTTVLALYRQSDWRYFEQTWQVEATLQSWHLHIYWRYIYLISQRKIIRFRWNFAHSSRFWTGWTSRDQKWKSCIGQTLVRGSNNNKYVLSNSESVQCNIFIFDHVTFIQFKICCCVHNFMKIGWFFTEIWRYIDFQNGGCPPSWNCFTTIRDHSRSLCCWPQLPVKFHVNLIHRSEFFAYLALMSIQAPKMGVMGDFGPLNVIIHYRDPQKAHPCVNPRLLSYQL